MVLYTIVHGWQGWLEYGKVGTVDVRGVDGQGVILGVEANDEHVVPGGGRLFSMGVCASWSERQAAETERTKRANDVDIRAG